MRGGVALAGAPRIVERMQRWTWLGGLGAFFLAAFFSFAAAADNPLRASKPEVKTAVVAAIEAQLEAFRKGDVVAAYSFAAVDLRAQTPLRAFVAIVQTNYPEIWENTRAEHGIVRDDGTRATVLVHVFSKEGDASYDYTLVKERVGWRVHDVLRHAKADKV